MPWHPVPRRAALAYLRAGALTCSRRIGAVTCGWLIKLRLAYILCYFIRNRRWALIVYSGFTSREYHVIRVDFIVALRRTKGRRRRTLRSPSPPSSGLHLLTPGDPLRRGITAAAGLYQFRISVSGADCSSPLRRGVWVLCVRAEVVRVSENHARHMSFVFHYWWDGLFVPAATGGFCQNLS